MRSTSFFNGSPYIFLIYYYITIYVCVPHFYDLSPLVGCSSSVYKEDYLQFFYVCPFDNTAVAVSGKVGCPLTGLTTPVGWLLLPKLTVLSRSAIAVYFFSFGGVFVLSRCFLDFSVGEGTFDLGLSQIQNVSSLFSCDNGMHHSLVSCFL